MSAKIDITGQQFGRLLALEPIDKRKGSSIVWKCQCDCGNVTCTRGTSLRKGYTKSCGCLSKEITSKITRKDITGHRFDKLVALEPTSRRDSNGGIIWKCRCDCGNVIRRPYSSLVFNGTTSCGCKKTKDITGQRFGRLIALSSTSNRKYNGSVVWECLCDCGNLVFKSGKDLQRTKSCGCLKIASEFVRGTNIKSIDVPIEITNCMKARRELKKAIKQAS